MIDRHDWRTPNGHRITMFREATAQRWRIAPVNIGAGAQFTPGFEGTVRSEKILRGQTAR